MFALVLFDIDGCTSIVDAKKCQVPDVTDLAIGQHVNIKFQKQMYKVEILKMSASKAYLNRYEDDWSSTQRSLALDREKKQRGNKEHGYLSVWPQDQENTAVEVPAEQSTESNNEETRNSERNAENQRYIRQAPRELKGTNGRKITILYEGSASQNSPNASPQRNPCYLEELSTDEAEVVELQMRCFERNQLSTASQTDKVVVIQDESEIIELLSKQKRGKEASSQTTSNGTKDMSVQTEHKSGKEAKGTKDMSVQTDLQDASHHVAVLNKKLDEILELLRGTLDASNKVNNLSDIVRWVSQNTSTPQPGLGGSVTIFPVDDSILEIPSRTITLSSSPVVRVERVAETLCSSPPAKKALFGCAPPTDAKKVPEATSSHAPPKTLGQPHSCTQSMEVGQTSSCDPSMEVGQTSSCDPSMEVGQSSSCAPATDVDQFSSCAPSMEVGQSSSCAPSMEVGQSSSCAPSMEVGQSSSCAPFMEVGQSSSCAPATDVDQSSSCAASMEVGQSTSAGTSTSSATGSASPMEGSNTTRNPLVEVTHQFNQRNSSTDDRHLILECNPTACMREIKDKTEVIPGNVEFRIRRDILADVKSKSCSNGNFLWILTRRIFYDEELIGRNFFGRKGRKPISPRRRKCLQAAYMDSCGTSYKDFTKAVSSINNGIRSLGR